MKLNTNELPFKLNLQFFAEDNPNGDDPSAGTKNTDKDQKDDKQEHMIPKSRFDEINSKYKDIQTKYDEIIKQQEEHDKKQKEEQGKFEELYKSASGELEGYKTKNQEHETKVKELETVIQGLLDTKLSTIPEELHEIIPENLSIVQKLDWINKAEQKGLLKTVKSDTPLSNPTNYKQQTDIDFTKFNPTQLMSMGYNKQ